MRSQWISKNAPSPTLLRFLHHQAAGLLEASTSITCPGLTEKVPRPRRHRGTSHDEQYSLKSSKPRQLQGASSRQQSQVSRHPQHLRWPKRLWQSHLELGRQTSRSICTSSLRSFGSPWKNKYFGGDGGRSKRKLPSLPSLLDDVGATNLGRRKPGNELKLRCTEIDENGNVTTVNGEFKKSELIAKYGLLPRDLRKIDSSLLPHILVRPSAILINLLHLRVLIKHNCVLVLDAYGSTDSFSQSQFMYDLCGKLSQKDSRQTGSLPYEFRALEAVLVSVTTGLEGEFEGVSEPVVRVLRELEEDIDRDKLRHLLIYSKKLGTFEQKARLVRDAIEDLLEADDDLVTMYLTERAQGKVREEDDHTDVEMLLESYHKVCDEIVQISSNLVSNIRNTEEIVKAILDANRNSLIMLDLKFSIGTLGLGSGAFIASLYGMNLKNFIEESDIGFLGVTAWSALFAIVVSTYGLNKLRKVQRVSMWGERGRGERGSWRAIGGVAGKESLPRWQGEGRKDRLQRLQQKAPTDDYDSLRDGCNGERGLLLDPATQKGAKIKPHERLGS